MYKIEFCSGVDNDLSKLGNNIKNIVFKKLKKLSLNPEIGQALGNKANTNLTNLKKIYLDNKRIRIVYKIKDKKLIVLIVAIGKRADLEVYKKANERLKDIEE